jgi:hypothetical protein
MKKMIGKKYDERKALCVCPAHRIEVHDRLKAYGWLEYGASFFTGHCVVCRCPSDQKVLFVRRTR